MAATSFFSCRFCFECDLNRNNVPAMDSVSFAMPLPRSGEPVARLHAKEARAAASESFSTIFCFPLIFR